MVAPGLAMFYGGLVRKKNVLGVIMQCVFLLGLMPTLWGLYGYSLAFGDGATGAMAGASGANSSNAPAAKNALWPMPRWIGDFSHVGLRGVQPRWSAELRRPVAPQRGDVPVVSHMLFHGMLFTVAAAVISGAFAERMRFASFALFAALWGTVVYCPLCHWIWGGGLLARGTGWAGGAIDFAGGTAIHVSAGVSALVCAIVMGKRLGHGNEPMPPHNLTYTTLGAALLWAGWFGFNAGRASEHDGVLSMPMAATQLAAAAGTLAWAGAEWWTRGRPSVLGACSGAVAGLVCVTPAAGYVALPAALAIGLAAGLACCFACNRLKTAMGYDDSLDAFGVHGVGGALGMALTGVFATRDVADPAISLGAPLGLVDGSAGLMAGQLVATAVAAGYSAVATFILLKLLDATLGLRVTHDEEIQGLDVSQHGEEGYIFF
jgi:Amt family ammonium transporter